MFRTITSKYAGTCKRCHTAFEAGAKIRYGGTGRTYHLKADCIAATVDTAAPVVNYPAGAQLRDLPAETGHAPDLDNLIERQAEQWAQMRDGGF